jgi:hypothetical protein
MYFLFGIANSSFTPVINISAGSNSGTLAISPAVVNQYNVQQVIGDVKASPIVSDVTFSFLMRTANFDLTLTAGMTMSDIIDVILVTGVTIDNGYITMLPEMRPLVVLGQTKDLPLLSPLLGLLAPETCISGTTFSYPINGLKFPLPMSTDIDEALLVITMDGKSVISNVFPNLSDTNNRIVATENSVTSVTASLSSIYGFPVASVNNVTVILKCN